MMDRKDETRKAYADRDDIKGYFLCEYGFEQGAKWADEHPRKGLVDIGKACEWLKDMMQGHVVLEVLSGEHYEKDLIKDFRKAMEGQE